MSEIVVALADRPGFEGLVSYVVRVYGPDRALTFRRDGGVGVLETSGGIGQGSSLGPFLYAFLTLDPLRRVAAAFQDVAFLSYLDDVVILAPSAERARVATQAVADELAGVGQVLNKNKTRALAACALRGAALGPDEMREFLLDGVPVPILAGPAAGLVVLGCAIGAENFVVDRLRVAVEEFVRDVAAADRVDDLQSRLLILRASINAKLRHLTRQLLPSARVRDALAAADDAVSLALARICMGDNGVTAWDVPLAAAQCRLRVKDGGVGVPSLGDFHVPAYLAAIGGVYARAEALPGPVQVCLMRDVEAGTISPEVAAVVGEFAAEFGSYASEDDPLPTTFAQLVAYTARKPAHLQARLSEVVHLQRRAAFEQRLRGVADNDEDGGKARRAMYKSVCRPGASTFLTMLPSDPHLRLGNHAFVVQCALRLGLTPASVMPAALVGKECCTTNADNGRLLTLFHAAACHNNAGGGTSSRHNAVVATLEHCLRRSFLPCVHEPRLAGDLFAGPDVLVDFGGTRRCAVDVSVRNPTAASVVNAAAQTALAACARAEAEKYKKYGPAHLAAGFAFYTLAFEITGAHGQQTRKFFDEFRTHLFQNVPVQPSFPVTWACRSYFTYTLQRVHATLLKYTALIVHAAVSRARFRAQVHLPAPLLQPQAPFQRRPRRH
jgi:hypothetical protein